MNSKVAVIMSTYYKDDSDHLKSAIDSVLVQPYDVDLYLFVDGDVPFDIRSVIEAYKTPKLFVHYSKSNVGLAAALNILIDKVIVKDYKYIARMDSDDISLPNRFSLQVEFLDNNVGVDILGGACEEFGSVYALNPKILPSSDLDLKAFAIHRCPFIHPTVMFRSEVFKGGIRYPENTTLSEDLSLWHTLAIKNYTFHNLPDVILKYRLSDSTLIRRSGIEKLVSEFKLRFDYMKKTKTISVFNVFLLSSRTFVFSMPPSILKLFYKYCR